MSAPLRGVLRLRFDVGQGRLVMAALAELPFRQVFELIGRLNQAANGAGEVAGEGFQCDISAAEWRLMLEALGKLPYEQVHGVIAALQRQVPRMADNDDGLRHGDDRRLGSGSH